MTDLVPLNYQPYFEDKVKDLTKKEKAVFIRIIRESKRDQIERLLRAIKNKDNEMANGMTYRMKPEDTYRARKMVIILSESLKNEEDLVRVMYPY